MADQLVAAGVHAILNFAPAQISVPDDVTVQVKNGVLEITATPADQAFRPLSESACPLVKK